MDVNPEAAQFMATDSGATEVEYLSLIESLIGVFKPTYLVETGTWHGDGAAAMLRAAGPRSTVISLCHHALDEPVREGLEIVARERESEIRIVLANTIDLIDGRCGFSWADLTFGKATFAFLDSSIPDRAREFEYISEPSNGVMDFSRPICVCVHDMSLYRHPNDSDSGHLPATVVAIEELCRGRGWQLMRLNQSRGMLVLIKYPDYSSIASTSSTKTAVIASRNDRNKSIYTKDYPLKVVSHDRGGFRGLTGENVLVYFPHGFGDWVHFSHVLPYLEPSNRYWMTRFGDDNSSVMAGSRVDEPILLGVKSAHNEDGGLLSNQHFGMDYHEIDGSQRRLSLPLSVYNACAENDITTALFTCFPETWGALEAPFHTKARGLLQHLVTESAVANIPLGSPLKSCISFDIPSLVTKSVEAKLQNYTGFGERKLCIVGRTGYTSTGKNWGHLWREEEDGRSLPEGEECREFMRLMLRKDPQWTFLVMEDRLWDGNDTMRSDELHCYSYAELFGTPDDPAIPFGYVMRALANLASLAIGVPAGSQHLCMVKQDLPCVGLWIEHYPSWYDEPKEASIHILSKHLRETRCDTRPGSFTESGDLKYRAMPIDTRRIYGEQALAAVEQLLGK
jgi:hypothetical protein